MRVIVSAGGTGGHIYPALAIINKLKERNKDLEVLYIGTTDRMESEIIPSKGITYKGINIHGIKKNIINYTIDDNKKIQHIEYLDKFKKHKFQIV